MSTESLLELYRAGSKHGQYQALPARIQRLLPPGSVSHRSRHERERLAFLCSKMDFDGLKVADIGGNTGYFTFEILDRGAASIDYFEGNLEHSQFVDRAARSLGLDGRLRTHRRYLDFSAPSLGDYDVVLLLNVLHHIGDDYGDPATGIEQVLPTICSSLRIMARHARRLVFQVGFNWKGNTMLPIFESGSRSDVIDLVAGLSDAWEMEAVGIARRTGGEIVYEDLSPANIGRDDSLGEFLNRPLFVLRSRLVGGE
ncbi:MAG: class I SAM-dependent methyltransferase [Burkholderiaceae bacterium]